MPIFKAQGAVITRFMVFVRKPITNITGAIEGVLFTNSTHNPSVFSTLRYSRPSRLQSNIIGVQIYEIKRPGLVLIYEHCTLAGKTLIDLLGEYVSHCVIDFV